MNINMEGCQIVKIHELKQHCGNCGVISFCGNPFGYCLCYDKRFTDVEEEVYRILAESASDTKALDECEGCERPDCGAYRYSDDDFEDEPCEYEDQSRGYYCNQVADYVYGLMIGKKGA